jgi:hypothetical protein
MYKLISEKWGNVVIRLSDGAFIPLVRGNRDYEVYQLWLAGKEYINSQWVVTNPNGNTPLPADD